MASNRDPFDALTEEWEPQTRRAFLEAVQGIVDRQNVSLIARLLENGDVNGALRAVGLDPLDFRGLDQIITQTFGAGGEAFAEDVNRQAPLKSPEGAIVQFFFNARNPEAENWIRTRSSNLITQIVDDQRNMVREFLRVGLVEGNNPRTTALDLVGRIDPRTKQRTGGVIGLTSGQEAWQRAYEAELRSGEPGELKKALARGLRDKRFDRTIAKAIRTGEPLPADTIQKMVIAYRNRSLKYRADTIARTETIRTLGQSQVETWNQAISTGRVRQDQLLKIPVSARDERVRHRHREVENLNAKGVNWSEPYKVPAGMQPQMHAPYDEPMCRCRERVKVDRFRGLE